MKTVYVGMSADLVHPGHINLLKNASSYGNVIVGLLTDKAISSYKRMPYMKFEHRKEVIENIKYVNQVILQETLSYRSNLEQLKPDYVIHGDDWRNGIQKETRAEVIDVLNSYGGKLIEIPYTEGISSSSIKNTMRELGTTPGIRLSMMKRLLNANDTNTINEVHNGLSGLITDNSKV